MQGGFSIRPALGTDIPAVTALFREYAASLGVDLAYQDFEAELSALPGAYAPPSGALLLAMDRNATPLGCVAIRPLGKPGVCEMKRLYARPDARGMGVGRALAQAAIQAAMRAGYRCLCLDTLPDMLKAQALYRALGFQEVEPYYPSPVAGTLFMALSLG